MKFQLARANDKTLDVNLSENGTPVDVTGYEFWFTVKDMNDNAEHDDDAVITKTLEILNTDSLPQTQIVLTAQDTDIAPATYKWDIKIKDLNGNLLNSRVGTLEVVERVTVRSDD